MIAKPQSHGSQVRQDPQVVEVLGRNLLVTELLRANLEVAFPIRDRGVDLIAYRDTGDNVQSFVACPIQMKAASGESFLIDEKYEPFRELILAYVWNVFDPVLAVTYALTYGEVLQIAEQMDYTRTAAWVNDRKYTCTRIGKRLRELLEPHSMTPERWHAKVARLAYRAEAVPTDENKGVGKLSGPQ